MMIMAYTVFGVDLSTILLVAAVAVIAAILERLVTRYLVKFAKRTHLGPSVSNNLILTFRILILIGAVAAIVRAGGLPTEWFVAFSALGGAAVGLASSKTIGNFVAGFYLLAARPFRVGDYVRLGSVEGIVQEITINYTKILTMGNNIVSISNLQIMDRDITNYLYETDEHGNVYCCNFEIGFDHSVSADKIAKIFNEVFEKHVNTLPVRPSYTLTRSDAFTRVYTVYLYTRHPEDIFVLKPQIAEELFKGWDFERAKTK
jgi:small-conductance mechanosensitive channel